MNFKQIALLGFIIFANRVLATRTNTQLLNIDEARELLGSLHVSQYNTNNAIANFKKNLKDERERFNNHRSLISAKCYRASVESKCQGYLKRVQENVVNAQTYERKAQGAIRESVVATRGGLQSALPVIEMRRREAEKNQDIPAVQKNVEDRLRILELNQRMNHMIRDGKEIGKIVDEMEDELDQTVVGLYLQDKIGQFLNSNVVCESISEKSGKHCSQPSEVKLDPQGILLQLFPELKKALDANIKDSGDLNR